LTISFCTFVHFSFGAGTQNPFASSQSLDQNPFEDPTPKQDHARFEELSRREQDLERRERELNQRADHLRTHGRNNWPPCMPHIANTVTTNTHAFHTSLPPHLPCDLRRDSRRFKAVDHSLIPVMARPSGNSDHKYGGLYMSSNRWFKRRRKRPRCQYRVGMVSSCLLFLAQCGIRYVFIIAPLSFLLWYRSVT